MNQREAVERFHLTFLRHFSAIVGPGTICLKGGVNLRLYHNSPRLSEDVDFDARVVGVDILKKNVKRVLDGRPLRSELAAVGISLSEIKPSKQTATTQRWKFEVICEVNRSPTRLEFSRRQVGPFEDCATDVPSPTLLGNHQVLPFVFPHYSGPAAYRQKIHALADRSAVQTRDVFDLHHLSRFSSAGRQTPNDVVLRAIAQLDLISFAMFREQVIPYLPTDLGGHYGTPVAWSRMTGTVKANLQTALPEAS